MKEKFNIIKYQLYATVCANLLSVGYGVILGWASPVLPLLLLENTPLRFGQLTENQISWITSCLCIGNLIGTIVIGFIVDWYGRKTAIYVTALPMVFSWLFIIMAKNVFQLYVARVLGGFVGGGTYIVIPLYVAEIAQNNIRGSLGSFVQVSCNLGILLGFIGGEYLNFYLLAYLALIIPAVFLIALIYCPETPRYLCLSNNNRAAEESLRFYRGIRTENTSAEFIREFEEIFSEVKTRQSVKLRIEDFSNLAAKKAILISGVMMLGTQMSGIFFIINYASLIFTEAASILPSNTSAIIFVLVNFLGSYLSIVLVDRMGRRVLLIVSSLLTGLCLGIMGLYLYLQSEGVDISNYAWVPIVVLSAAIFNSSWGIISLPYMIMAELLPTKTRGVITTGWRVILSIIAFILLKYYYTMVEYLKLYGCMWMFAACCLVEMVFVIFCVPETKCKSIEEIVAMLGTETPTVQPNAKK